MNLDILRERAKIVSSIRRFFDEQDFVEVETAVRIPAPAPEEHIDCPPVEGGGFLRASPEIQMKKLLAAGMDKIYQIGPCFREGERGSRHNPEFTMIEWYRRNADYLHIKADLESLFSVLTNQAIKQSNNQTIRVRDAYLKYAGWDPWSGGWDQDRFDFDMATKIEPAIKELGGGVFLMDYPPQAASLSKLSHASTPSNPSNSSNPSNPNAANLSESLRGDAALGVAIRTKTPLSATARASSPRKMASNQLKLAAFPSNPSTLSYAERWEFYYNGMELANCFTELCDSDEQSRRFLAAKEARRCMGEADYPIDDRFLSCLSDIGSAAGVALGVDRLVMVLTKTKEISAVRAEI